MPTVVLPLGHWTTINGTHVFIANDGRMLDAGGNEIQRGPVKFAPSERMKRAMESHKGGSLQAQRVADEQERIVSNAIGIPRTKDNSAFDCRNGKTGVELKTMQESANGKITMSKTALARKMAEASRDKLKTFTVVADKRGGSTKYYYKEGLGSFRVGSMTPVKLGDLKGILK